MFKIYITQLTMKMFVVLKIHVINFVKIKQKNTTKQLNGNRSNHKEKIIGQTTQGKYNLHNNHYNVITVF